MGAPGNMACHRRTLSLRPPRQDRRAARRAGARTGRRCAASCTTAAPAPPPRRSARVCRRPSPGTSATSRCGESGSPISAWASRPAPIGSSTPGGSTRRSIACSAIAWCKDARARPGGAGGGRPGPCGRGDRAGDARRAPNLGEDRDAARRGLSRGV